MGGSFFVLIELKMKNEKLIKVVGLNFENFVFLTSQSSVKKVKIIY